MVMHTQMLNVQVPFFFKYAVDYYNKLPALTSPEGTILTVGTAMLLGCMYNLCVYCMYMYMQLQCV